MQQNPAVASLWRDLPRADAPKVEEQRRSLATPENYAVFWKKSLNEFVYIHPF